MFSRLCKNSIFPSGNSGGSGGSNGSSSGSGNTSGASNAASLSVAATGPSTSEPAHSSSRTSTPAASVVASSRRHLNLPLLPVLPPRSAAQIRPEPPPPYWAHYQHRVVPAASSAAVVVHPPIPLALGSSDSSRSSSSSSSSNSSSAAAAAVSNARRHQLRGTAAVYVGNVVTSDGFRRNHGNGGATLEQGSNQQGRGVAAAVIGQQRYNIARQQQQQQGQRIKEYFLSQDAFCPDLVRNCKITADPQSGRSSPAEPVPSSSSQPQPHSSSNNDPQDQDVYVEIEELNQSLAQLGAPSSTSPTSPSSSVATVVCGDMGQNLSIRRPKISLTWVLREQQQQQQQQTQRQHQQQNQSIEKSQSRRASPVKTSLVAAPVPPPAAPSSGSSSGHHHQQQLPARKKSRTRSKERLFSEKYVSDNNLTEYGYNEKLKAVVGGGASAPASTEHHGSSNSNGHHQHHHHNGVYRKSNRSYRKNSDRLRKKERSSTLVYPSLVQSETVDILLNNNNSIIINLNQDEQQLKSEKSLKNTYSEPSLYTTVSEPSSSKNRHRHRRRRERYHRTSSSSQSQSRFGYEIQNVDEFLSKCSLSSPGNIPVVLAAAATLYQTRPGSYQIEIPLPLGMVVNAVFKNQNWLYVQTPHAEEGYVAYETCLPLGILPPNQRSSSTSKPTPCWESTKDVFPRPSGNLTDSEKEIQQLRGNGSGSNAGGVGTRSEGRRTPRLKRTTNGTSSRSVASIACSSEKNLDSLYLRVANQPKSADSPQQSQFAQLKLTTKVLNGKSMAAAATAKLDKVLNIDQPLDKLPSNGDYIQLHKPMQHNPQQQNPFHHHHHHKILVKSGSGGSGHSAASTSALNGGHYHKTVNNLSYSTNPTSKGLTSAGATTAVRQTLLAITDSYSSETVSVQKGDVVTLLACKEYQEKGLKNYKQWFFVRTRDGHEGYIPAEAAGHGFL